MTKAEGYEDIQIYYIRHSKLLYARQTGSIFKGNYNRFIK